MTVERNTVVHEVVVDDSKAVEGAARVIGAMEKMANAEDQATAANQRQASGFSVLEAALAKVTPAQVSAANALDRLKAQIDPAEAALQRMARAEGVVERAVRQKLIAEGDAIVLLDRYRNHLGSAVPSIDKFSSTSRGMGMAVQQAGYQVGDFAVQVASGQGVLRPFIQQGTQLISMFGPWGAVIGAAGAVLGALYTSLSQNTNAADKAKTSYELLTDAVSAFNEETKKSIDLSDKETAVLLEKAHALNVQARAELASLQSSAASMQADIARREADLAATNLGGALSGGVNPLAEKMGIQLDAEKKSLAELADKINEVRGALDTSQGDIDDYAAHLKTLRATQGQEVDQNKAVKKSVEDVTAARRVDIEAQSLAADKARTYVAAERARIAQISDPNVKHEEELRLERQQKINDLTAQYGSLTDDAQKHLAEFDAQQAYDDQTRYWTDVANLAKQYSDDVKGYIVDGLTGATNNGKSLWSNMWDAALAGGKRFLINFAATLAQQKFIMPILMNFIGSNSSLFGVTSALGGSGGVGGLAALTPEGGGLSSLASGLSSAWSLLNNGAGSTLMGLGTDFAKSSVGQWLGLSGTTTYSLPAGVSGPVGTGIGLTDLGSGLSSALGFLGAGGTGYGVGSLISSLGIGNPTGSSIGGALGGAIGSIVPGIGTIIGSVAGSLIGGLFGNNKPSDMFALSPIDLAKGTVGAATYDSSEKSQDNIDASQSLANAFLEAQKTLVSITGGTSPNSAYAKVGSRDGIVVGVGDDVTFWNKKNQKTFSNSEEGAQKALDWMVEQLATQMKGVMDEDYQRILQMGGTAEEILTNLSAAQKIKGAGIFEAVTAASDALETLVSQFDELKQYAVDLSLSTDKLIETEKRQLQALETSTRSTFTQKVQDYIGQFLTPLKELQSAVVTDTSTLSDKFLDAQASFREISTYAAQGSEVALSMLSTAGGLYLQYANELKSQSLGLRTWLDDLMGSDLSTSTPLEKLNASRSTYEDLLAQVQGGDMSKSGDLTQAAEAYLRLAQEYGASGPLYQEAYTNVTTSIGALADKLDGYASAVDQQDIAKEIADTIGPLIDELSAAQDELLTGIQPTLENLNQNFRDSIDTLRDEGVQTREILAKIADAITGSSTLPAATPVETPSTDTGSGTDTHGSIADWIKNYFGTGSNNGRPGQSGNGLKLNFPDWFSNLQAHAGGGLVTGPGTGTSDSVLMWGSAGEYVNTAETVSRLGVGFFDSLNRGGVPAMQPRNDNSDVVSALGRSSAAIVQAIAALREENAQLREENRALYKKVDELDRTVRVAGEKFNTFARR